MSNPVSPRLRTDQSQADLLRQLQLQELADTMKKKKQHDRKYWVKGLCNKGEDCSYLHSYIPEKIPVCKKFQMGQCFNEKCLYIHTHETSHLKPCEYYERGFCKLGLMCPNPHVEKKLCPDYLIGFCINGPKCEFLHLRVLISPEENRYETLVALVNKKKGDRCNLTQMWRKRAHF
jgi:hypothetical protein